MSKLRKTLYKLIETEELFSKGASLLISCSGGPDSFFLLNAMVGLKSQMELRIGVFTMDHSLRFNGEQDMAFVKQYCEKHCLPCYAIKEDVGAFAKAQGLSIEMAGRTLRYRHLERIRTENNYEYVLLGHHGDDQSETILLHLIRGTGLGGLRGMAMKEGAYLRPLLSFTKQQIEDALAEEGIAYCVDETNETQAYERNRIRHELLPILRTYNEQIDKVLRRLSDIVRGDDDLLDYLTEETLNQLALKETFLSHRQGYNRIRWRQLPQALRYRLWRKAAKAFYPYGVTPTLNNIKTMDALLFGDTNKEFSSKWMKIYIEYDTIYFAVLNEEEKGPQSFVPSTRCCNYMAQPPIGTFVIPKAYGAEGLVIRPRQQGDRIILCNKERQICGHKKVKDYLIDRKVPPSKRDQILWLVAKDTVLCEARADRSFALYDPQETDYLTGFFKEDCDD